MLIPLTIKRVGYFGTRGRSLINTDKDIVADLKVVGVKGNQTYTLIPGQYIVEFEQADFALCNLQIHLLGKHIRNGISLHTPYIPKGHKIPVGLMIVHNPRGFLVQIGAHLADLVEVM